MASQLKSELELAAFGPANGSKTQMLPLKRDNVVAERRVVSDSALLRISTALQESLQIRDVINAFGHETRRIVRDVSVRYRNRRRRILVEDRAGQFNRCSFELNLRGDALGEIVFSRSQPWQTFEQELLEALLHALVHPLRNALLYEQALTQALKDPLTGVNNRASMDAYLRHQTLVSDRHRTPLSLIMFDIDFFKSVNDRFGHVAGDVVLRAVAKTIVRAVRNSDVVFRYGGEEFVVVLTNTDVAGAEFLAERVRHAVVELDADALGSAAEVTVSAGVAEFRSGDSALEILSRADKMLYVAKDQGRNRVITSYN